MFSRPDTGGMRRKGGAQGWKRWYAAAEVPVFRADAFDRRKNLGAKGRKCPAYKAAEAWRQ